MSHPAARDSWHVRPRAAPPRALRGREDFPFYPTGCACGTLRAPFQLLDPFIVASKASRKKTRTRVARPSVPWTNLVPSGSNLHVEDFLTFRVTRLSNALRTHLTKRYLEEFGLSLPEWRLLALIARFAPMRFSELTNRSSMDKGQVSRTLRVMAKKGLTNLKTLRQRGSRSAEALAAPVMVSITAKGRTLYGSILPVARRRQAEMLLTLSESDRRALYETLEKLFTTIGQAALSGDDE
jgi:DNA-binding MarR family transcriptional regulator